MSIQPVGTGGIGPTLGADPSNFITPDSLMAYCESRMSSLDSQMKTAFAQQTKTNEDSQALTWLQSALANCSQGGIAQGGSGNNHAGSDLVRAFEVTINKVGRDTELGKKLVAQQSALIDDVDGNLRESYGNNSIWKDPQASTSEVPLNGSSPTKPRDDGSNVKTVTGERIQTYAATLKTEQSDLNGGAELNMINLQAIMSQRQTAIQLTTNLVQALGDSSNKIAANIGH
jgi:hypothetical protein